MNVAPDMLQSLPVEDALRPEYEPNAIAAPATFEAQPQADATNLAQASEALRTAGSDAISPPELAAHLAARMCHDFISPASAITSGLDLLDDPSAADMRDDAMSLIAASARKLVAMLEFSRVAFGASASAESFDSRSLEGLTRAIYEHVRPNLVWAVALPSVNKATARALLNLAQVAANALPMGGTATVTADIIDGQVIAKVEARSHRVRLRPEVIHGLNGERQGPGLAGQWVQAYYVYALVRAAGGVLEHQIGDEQVTLIARLPAA